MPMPPSTNMKPEERPSMMYCPLQEQQPHIHHNFQLQETNFRVTKIINLGYKLKEKGTRTQITNKPVFVVVVAVEIVRQSQSDGGAAAPASDVVDVTVEEKGDAVNGLHSAFVFLGQRRGWRRNEGALFWFPKTRVVEEEEKRV
ncbi:hypothetical protein DEO72_LG5g374 [Vigna unguiculata]|uniref:Uncharacterized protein n=1 Tax=Vigna unguiculata TaxID=3917 RepID=A0A4D6LTQ9_VIGUN|nr:hypothetical protein DEO72_LG5g374 [Vigna unguiculata]